MRTRTVLSAAALLLIGSMARGELIDYLVCVGEFNNLAATPDGVIHDSEYGSDPFPGFGTGVGGILRTSGSQYSDRRLLFNLRPSLGTLSVAIRGGASIGDRTVIVLLDTRTGGRTAGSGPGITPLNDTTDAARSALSALQGNYPTGGPFGFAADFAITFNADGAGLFAFPDNGSGMFTQIGAYSGVVNTATGTGEGQWSDSLLSPGGVLHTIGFVALVSGPSGMSNESSPLQPFNTMDNPGFVTTDIPNFNMIGVFIPAPASALMVLSGLLAWRPRQRTTDVRASQVYRSRGTPRDQPT